MSTWAVYVAVATAHAPPRAHFEPVFGYFWALGLHTCHQAAYRLPMLLFANSMIILGGHRANTGSLYTRYGHIHAPQAKNAVLGFGP